jgi:hypothetical protein
MSSWILAYRKGGDISLSQLTWFDRTGQPAGTIGKPDYISNFRLSPDEKRIALDRREPLADEPDIWMIDSGQNCEPFHDRMRRDAHVVFRRKDHFIFRDAEWNGRSLSKGFVRERARGNVEGKAGRHRRFAVSLGGARILVPETATVYRSAKPLRRITAHL